MNNNFFKNLGIGQTKIIKDWFNFFKEKYNWTDISLSYKSVDNKIIVKSFHRYIFNEILLEDNIPCGVTFEFIDYPPINDKSLFGIECKNLHMTKIIEKLNSLNFENIDTVGVSDSRNDYMLITKNLDGRWIKNTTIIYK